MGEVLKESKVLEEVFKDGFALEQVKLWRGQRRNLAFYTKSIGELRVITGKIVADDPYSLIESTPFVQTFPTGSFPIELSIARITDPTDRHKDHVDERIAFARITFNSNPVARWVGAEREVQADANLYQLDEHARWGYAVDSGTGSFLDAEAYAWLAFQQEQENPEVAQELMEAWELAAEESYLHTRSWLVQELDNGHNIALFSSGFGNGIYHSYIGYDNEGNCVQLLTDFNVYPD